MQTTPGIRCDAWKDGADIPVEYTAPKEPNLNLPGDKKPQNRKPVFSFSDIPDDTRAIALVVHDVLDGDPVEGVRPGWTHYTAIFSPNGKLLAEGLTDENETGWTGPYPAERGEYHCTAYFLAEFFQESEMTRSIILEEYRKHGTGIANMVGKYTNPTASII